MRKKIVIIFCVLVAIMLCLLVFITRNVYLAAEDVYVEIVDINTHIGESILLKGDTLLIMDYSSFDNSYKLDDGRTINTDLAKKLLIK